MSDIDFLQNKKDDQEEGKAGGKKPEVAWSRPENDQGGPNKGPFAFSKFFKGKTAPAPVQAGSAAPDRSKLKASRREILKLIKESEAAPAAVSPKMAGGFLFSLGDKLKRPQSHKEILVDYQKIFKEEKEKRSPASAPAAAAPAGVPAVKPAAKNTDFSKLFQVLREKVSAWFGPRPRLAAPASSPAAESKPPVLEKAEKAIKPEAEAKEEKKEEKTASPEPDVAAAEAVPEVPETNLITGEIITFFDWGRKTAPLIGAILIPLAVLGVAYLGLLSYQKLILSKNDALNAKLAELAKTAEREENGLSDITAFQNKLKIISPVFKQHIYWSNFFKFLEDNTIKDVYYTGFSGDTGGSYSLGAVAKSFANISGQVDALKNNKKITKVSATGGELATGGDSKTIVKFILEFAINRSLFTE